jgi:hypothetical protein
MLVAASPGIPKLDDWLRLPIFAVVDVFLEST